MITGYPMSLGSSSHLPIQPQLCRLRAVRGGVRDGEDQGIRRPGSGWKKWGVMTVGWKKKSEKIGCYNML